MFLKMPDSFFAVDWSNQRFKTSILKYYRTNLRPEDRSLELGKKWVIAIRQDK